MNSNLFHASSVPFALLFALSAGLLNAATPMPLQRPISTEQQLHLLLHHLA